MTDKETVTLILGIFGEAPGDWMVMSRNGRLLLALPTHHAAADQALGLYQPQRAKARITAAVLRAMISMGMHRWLLPRLSHRKVGFFAAQPPLPAVSPHDTGILLGSPEHRTRRVIVSFLNGGRWEVAKVFFGEEGVHALAREARTLEDIGACAPGVPQMLGLHRAGGATVMRMPYLTGSPIPLGKSEQALRLLNEWAKPRATEPITGFPEWEVIASALVGCEAGGKALERLSSECLSPVIRHGDFARWNLLGQSDGSLMALDWEWGHSEGMPGIDLVHYFLQDARLVERLKPVDAIRKTVAMLGTPACKEYLSRTGWSGDPILPIIACLAYKQGAGHQENGDVLEAAVRGFGI